MGSAKVGYAGLNLKSFSQQHFVTEGKNNFKNKIPFESSRVKEIKYRGTLFFEKKRYRLIILRESLLFTLLSKYLTAFSTHQYCLVEFSFKFFDKSVNKRNFLKNINLYCPSFCSYSKVFVWCPLFAY